MPDDLGVNDRGSMITCDDTLANVASAYDDSHEPPFRKAMINQRIGAC